MLGKLLDFEIVIVGIIVYKVVHLLDELIGEAIDG